MDLQKLLDQFNELEKRVFSLEKRQQNLAKGREQTTISKTMTTPTIQMEMPQVEIEEPVAKVNTCINYNDDFHHEVEEFERKMKMFDRQFQSHMDPGLFEKLKWQFTNYQGEHRTGLYYGEVKDGKPNGRGKYVEDGQWLTIKGQWQDGHPQGRIMEFYSDHQMKFIISNGKPEGKFVINNKNGIREEGSFQNGHIHGILRKIQIQSGNTLEEKHFNMGQSAKT